MIFLQSSLNASGQVQAVTSGTVTSFNGAQAYVGSSPLVTEDAIAATDCFVGGLRYRADGALRVFDGAGAFVIAGMAVTANGQLCISSAAVSGSTTLNGVAVTPAGVVYMSTGGSPPSYTGPLDQEDGFSILLEDNSTLLWETPE